MNDLISRKTAIKFVSEIVWQEGETWQDVQDRIVDGVIYLPSANPKRGEWIPCSEKLPEERGLYFVTEQNFGGRKEADMHDVVSHTSYHYGDDKWSDRFYSDDVSNITAWMPLPEPYKAESEDKE